MNQEYKGTIVKESLSDLSVLDFFKILKEEAIGSDDDLWHLIKVRGSLKNIEKLKSFIKYGPWYANFWTNKKIVIVFKNKLVTNEKEAMAYGLSIGIPKKQLDFIKN